MTTTSSNLQRYVLVSLVLAMVVVTILRLELQVLKAEALQAASSSALATTTTTLYQTVIERCAPHLAQEQRRVLFVKVASWEGFYNGTTNGIHSRKTALLHTLTHNFRQRYDRGGENYVFASLAWALQQNGFVVDTTKDDLKDFTPQELAQYHRIFKNQVDWPSHLEDHPEILCKIRSLSFWGNWKPTQEEPWDPRQILSPYPDAYNTFVGFFVHNLIKNGSPDDNNSNNASTQQPHRTKHGFLLGKKKEYFQKKHHPILQALMDDGFTLHSTCKDPMCDLPVPKQLLQVGKLACLPNCGLPPGVIVHGRMSPQAYANLMSQMAFLIGFHNPVVSPSPLLGMAHGAAWLNPLDGNEQGKQHMQQVLHDYPLHWHHPNPIQSQHKPLSLLGMPYVYNIDLDNVTSVIEAAHWAVQHRFSSYIPPDYMPQAMLARACGIVSDNALCQCPNPTFGRHKHVSVEGENSNVDCHGNSYIQNWQ